jgi:uncharacterized repeat protein (TIGR01451 family)
MHKLRILIVIGVLLVAFALVGTSLAAASQARQAVTLAEISKFIPNSSSATQGGENLPTGQLPPHPANVERVDSSAPAYTPYLPEHPTVDRQLPEGRQPDSRSNTISGDAGDWESIHTYAPTILDESGTLYMWYSGIDWDGNTAIGLATSTDGITWTKSLSNPFLVGTESSILKVDSTDYRMYYSIWNEGNIYVALSTDGLNWTPGVSPVFSGTHQTGDWDMDFVADPMVYFDGIGTYYMFYEGGTNDPELIRIGLATSSDGFTWTRYQEDPVLDVGDPGSWDENWVLDPMVIVDGMDWKMWYRGMGTDNSRAIGYATSTDGVNWTKYASNPVFTANPGEWDDGGPSNMWVRYDGTYQMWYYTNRQIGYATSDDGINWVRPLDHPVLQPSPSLYLEVNYAHDWAHIYTLPNETVTVTLEDEAHNFKGMVTGKTNTWGDFWSGDWQWVPEWQYISAFDSIYIETAGLTEEVEPIGEMQGEMDIDNDIVIGSLNAPWFDEVQMACELWSDPGGYIDLGMIDGDGGTFECDWGAEGVDLKAGMQVALVYYDPGELADKVINILETPWMRVNYGHDWVGGNYPAGHTFNITLYDSLGEVKATVEVQSEVDKGWSGDGFETSWEQWTPPSPDIQPYDKVTFVSDDGYNNTIPVGDIQGTLDIEQDLISGPVFADWYTDDLYVECHPWGGPPGTPGKNSTAGPDGDPPYTCDWRGEWDILPGQDVAVMYLDPVTTDRVINVFREPSPNLSIGKWAEGSGQVLPGGSVIFTIRYSNDGEATAESFTITDTLPASTTYLADSSGVTPTTGDGWVAWEFGAINPGEWGQFQVILLNDAQPWTTLENWAEVSAPFDFDDGNDHANAQAYVGEGNYNLYVKKHPSPGDPTPGETFIYNIDYGNQDAYASGAVTLTETLPEGTSLVDWYSWNSYNLWEQVSYDDNVLVLTVPTLPGYWGDQLRLTLRVDDEVSYGTQLTNTVEVTSPFDVDPWNNFHLNSDAWVNPPRLDGRIDKQVPWGGIYPGGELVYPISFSNDGNTTFDALITDTLPEGMSFVASPAWRHGVEVPFEPVYVDDQVVVWEFSQLPPGEWIDVDLRLKVDEGFEAGSTATNCIEINPGDEEASPWNNAECVDYTVQELGPNLRLTKNYWWNGEGQLQYQVEIQNIGSETLDNIWVTDTYPLSTTWNGVWWVWGGRWITMTSDITNNQLVFWVEALYPSDNSGVGFQVDLDGEIVGEKGLVFTNQVEAPVAGDVNPADNTDEVIAFTGADVFIEKWLSDGVALPGEILTFTVQFGNLNQSPWDPDGSVGSHITDTLPAGMTFITATAPWDASQFWTPESYENGMLRWGWGTMWSNNTWRFDLVVQLDEDLKDGDMITNFIEAYGDNPEDFDFDWSNNFDEYSITIDIPTEMFFLPMVWK